MLDFDFHKICSISLQTINIYSCLSCGKYFQGKGKQTHAYIHSLEQQHNIFINLKDQSVWCLPDNYEVYDTSLNDIKYNLRPIYTKDIVAQLEKEPIISRGLDGTAFYPGCLGLNNLKNSDYINVVIQALCRISPLRDFCLLRENRQEEDLIKGEDYK